MKSNIGLNVCVCTTFCVGMWDKLTICLSLRLYNIRIHLFTPEVETPSHPFIPAFLLLCLRHILRQPCMHLLSAHMKHCTSTSKYMLPCSLISAHSAVFLHQPLVVMSRQSKSYLMGRQAPTMMSCPTCGMSAYGRGQLHLTGVVSPLTGWEP